jgi:hypothetical protein
MSDPADDAVHALTAAGEAFALAGQEEIALPIFSFEFGYWLGKVLGKWWWGSIIAGGMQAVAVPQAQYPVFGAVTPAADAWNNVSTVLGRWTDSARIVSSSIGRLGGIDKAKDPRAYAFQQEEIRCGLARISTDKFELVSVIQNTVEQLAGTEYANATVTPQQVRDSRNRIVNSGQLPAGEEALVSQLRVTADEKQAIVRAIASVTGDTLPATLTVVSAFESIGNALAQVDYYQDAPDWARMPLASLSPSGNPAAVRPLPVVVDKGVVQKVVSRQPISFGIVAPVDKTISARKSIVGAPFAALAGTSGGLGREAIADALSILLDAIARAADGSSENGAAPQALMNGVGGIPDGVDPAQGQMTANTDASAADFAVGQMNAGLPPDGQ